MVEAGGVAQVSDTRVQLLEAAERLFAERGIAEVSHRQVALAAGQANNSAVAYHVGSRADLVLAIVRRHMAAMDRIRGEMMADAADPSILVAVGWLVRPVTQHLDDLGVPSWYARFAAQVTTDPVLRELILLETVSSPVMQRAHAALVHHYAALPARVVMLRTEMVRHLIVHICAERELALATGAEPLTASWADTGDALVDAVVGLLAAAVTTAP